MGIIKKILIALCVAVVVIFVLFLGNVFLFNQENSFIQEVLKGAGTTINKPSKEYSDEFAAKVIDLLISDEEVQSISLPNARPMKPVSLLFDFGRNGGKSLSLQKYIDLNGSEYITVSVERPDEVKLRHKIRIGTDLAGWELIKKESNNSNAPFKRTYLFISGRGENKRIQGLCFYEGSMIELEFQGFVDDSLIKKFETVTWNISRRIDGVYRDYLRSLSEGPLFANDPIITRPDLPDVN